MQPIDLSQGLGRREVSAITGRFLELHQQRLQRIADDLPEAKRDVLSVLPLLLHLNHPSLPGYVSGSTPAGIPGFQPGAELQRIAKGMFRGFSDASRTPPRLVIQGLYAMGSVGSMAYSRRSDLDFWVCHDPRLNPEELDQLRSKLAKIEAFAEERGLEVHFFLMNLERFRAGEAEALSKESSGSTQHILLLEEFYRTAVYFAGRYPLWWLVPVAEEANYTEFCEHQFSRGIISRDDYLDFGGLQQIPPDEFFGTAHWQLFKGVGSPYKSVLKILLVEAYARQYPRINWLCNSIKAAVFAGRMEQLDPYLLVYQRIASYLEERGESERLELARRCFYFKVDRPLTKQRARSASNWQLDLLERLTREWGWQHAQLINLDSRRSWKVNQVMQERDLLVRELTRSYKVLVEFAQNHGDNSKINPAELKLLGRKLYASLERRPGKIDSINPGISNDLSEPMLCIHRAGPRWALYRGALNAQQAKAETPLKQSQILTELIAWLQLNGILAHDTRLKPYTNQRPSENELLALRQSVCRLLPDSAAAFRNSLRSLGRPARLRRCGLFINPEGMDQNGLAGTRIITDSYDPLSFGKQKLCLVQTLEQILCTSWGEVHCARYEGAQGLMEALTTYLRLSIGNGNDAHLPELQAHCGDKLYGATIARRVDELFSQIGRVFGPEGSGGQSRYLLPLGNTHYLIQRKDEDFSYQELPSQKELFQAMAEPMSRYSPLVPDPRAFPGSPLHSICKHSEAGQLQLFYLRQKDCIDLWVMDENGSIFYQQLQETDPRFVLARQHRFLSSIKHWQGLTAHDHLGSLLQDPPRYYRLDPAGPGNWKLIPIAPPESEIDSSFMPLRLVVLSNQQLVLSCGEQEFSSLVHGKELFRVIVEHILAMRQGRKDYPIYLTAVEPQALDQSSSWHSMRLLQYRRQIEFQLNRIMQELLQAGRS
ncbi:MAG: class I adenylate cyclase [Gammaproteobacteria bacterium]|nr:class I adenylate cyclase [Gammaproteobacteria bacterium]